MNAEINKLIKKIDIAMSSIRRHLWPRKIIITCKRIRYINWRSRVMERSANSSEINERKNVPKR